MIHKPGRFLKNGVDNMSKTKATFGSASDSHFSSSDFGSALSLLRTLIAGRKLTKEAIEESTVIAAFDCVGRSIQAGNAEARLEAVSILGKAAEISKPVAALVGPLLRTGLGSPLPPVGSWGSADDRYYLAKGISVSREHWITLYAAIELAKADATERASREVWAEIAVYRAENLARALEVTASALAEDQRSAGYTVDTACRKLNRTIDALHQRLPIADVPIGEGFGKAYSELVASAAGRSGPESRSLKEQTAINVLDLTVEMLRLRFAVTLDSDVYQAVRAVLSWWKPARPPTPIASRSERVARIAMDSLHTLSRQGVAQRNLRHALVSAFGADLVNSIGAEIVLNDPSLDPSIALWLAQGRELAAAKSNPAVRQMNETELDELVAQLLLAIDGQEGGSQSLQLLADDIELLEPGHGSTIQAAIARARLVAQWVQAVAAKRRLVAAGTRGDLVKYDPALHETADDLQPFESARIRVPGVVRQQTGLPASIVLKGQVVKP